MIMLCHGCVMVRTMQFEIIWLLLLTQTKMQTDYDVRRVGEEKDVEKMCWLK